MNSPSASELFASLKHLHPQRQLHKRSYPTGRTYIRRRLPIYPSAPCKLTCKATGLCESGFLGFLALTCAASFTNLQIRDRRVSLWLLFAELNDGPACNCPCACNSITPKGDLQATLEMNRTVPTVFSIQQPSTNNQRRKNCSQHNA